MSPKAQVAVIGGSGVYDLDGLTDVEKVDFTTPWGAPSDQFTLGNVGDVRVAFLPRHGSHHQYMPTEVPYRANIYALAMMGVQRLLSVSAVGSLTEEYEPGDFVMVDQFIDRTNQRQQTFFGGGIVAHMPMADPIDMDMARAVAAQADNMPELKVHLGGTYVTMEGPQFSTRAESELYRSWGAKIIGMTNGTEAKLAREAGICFATIAMVTDFDCWHPHHDDVDVELIVQTAQNNARKVRQLVWNSIQPIAALGESPWLAALKGSVMTPPKRWSDEARTKNEAILRNAGLLD